MTPDKKTISSTTNGTNSRTNVVAVVGTRPEVRFEYAAELARMTGRTLVPALRLRLSEDPVVAAVSMAGQVRTSAGVVVEIPDLVSTSDLVAGLTEEDGTTCLTSVVCVIDAAHGVEDLFREDYLAPKTGQPSTAMARSLVSITHVEFASTLVLVNWEDVPTDELHTLAALFHHLNPGARMRWLEESIPEEPTGPDYEATVDRPGWLNLLHQGYETFVQDQRISAVDYHCIRPFHPVRMHDLVHELMDPGRFGTVVRSAGYCRVASSPHITGHWNHVGKVMSLSPVGLDDDLRLLLDPWADTEPFSLGQDLAFIGLDMDRDALIRALDHAVLTDEEFLQDPSTWSDQVRRMR